MQCSRARCRTSSTGLPCNNGVLCYSLCATLSLLLSLSKTTVPASLICLSLSLSRLCILYVYIFEIVVMYDSSNILFRIDAARDERCPPQKKTKKMKGPCSGCGGELLKCNIIGSGLWFASRNTVLKTFFPFPILSLWFCLRDGEYYWVRTIFMIKITPNKVCCATSIIIETVTSQVTGNTAIELFYTKTPAADWTK